ncbi:quinol oxidase [Sulfolobus sp. A20]|uniref:TQO small subunit DoxA domain-containing protein n=1 Tax=Saccharolobus sp. A20 TaxID=1891280 RepID=UPI000846144F|nr:TQO small subunit DoxA domain-containing protein [Sulfolobus sp. A20]TRM75005.1 quinol oxidase [Sulfolobus sp. B5]TRM75919.1 quinol oxidase [Sulfolobus sp. E5]TRM81817.1 quinol oxidase [Sulfolobus sp. D5]TRM83808.1 quinol oxidase [Sulfolobus sp. A20-N-F6]TRM84598.1 quinol oxidase [Sulfolobus sp. F3]TRM89686.1 quinol oxidase [Sulfolobus sp. C3]TRN00948.1 quinol oxidase [Sulfolobus sp. F1]TRN01723.1 quinol oxidase [Sulfolobus sp. E1]
MVNKVTIVGIIFSLIVVGWILGTGQWAYGNVVGPLVNNSKLPKLEITYANAFPVSNGTKIILNITDVDGPDAYPASGTMMMISNSTWSLTLNSTEIAKYTVNVIQAPWNANKKDYVNYYSGFVVILGSEAQFQLIIPIHLSPGTYKITIVTPAINPNRWATTTITVS